MSDIESDDSEAQEQSQNDESQSVSSEETGDIEDIETEPGENEETSPPPAAKKIQTTRRRVLGSEDSSSESSSSAGEHASSQDSQLAEESSASARDEMSEEEPLKLTSRQRALKGSTGKSAKPVPMYEPLPTKGKKLAESDALKKKELDAKRRKLKDQQKLENEKQLVIQQLLSPKFKNSQKQDKEGDEERPKRSATSKQQKITYTGDYFVSSPKGKIISFVPPTTSPPALKKPKEYPKPQLCQRPNCENPKKYLHQKSSNFVCSLECYHHFEKLESI